MVKFAIVLLLSATVLAGASHADWTGGVEGGSVIRDGNSATRIRIRASLDELPLSHYVYAEWVRSDSNSYEIGYKPKYWFTDKVYGFGEGRLRIDGALSIDRDTLVLGGVGIELISTEVRQVTFEAGIGYQRIDYALLTGLDELGSGVGTLRGHASQILSDLLKLELDANIFNSESSLESLLEAGVSIRLQQGAVKISHRIRRVDIDGFDVIDDSDTAVAFTLGF